MDRPPRFDLARAPFGVGAHEPQQASADLVAAFEVAAERDARVEDTYRAIEQQLATLGALEPGLVAGARSLARAVDRDAPRLDARPYHGRQHFCEVMLTALYLGRLNLLAAPDAHLLVVAALMHDLCHEPGAGAFANERASARLALPTLQAAGVGEPTLALLQVMVLATEPHDGVKAARAAFEHHRGRPHDLDRLAYSGLRPLFADRSLSDLALLLCEADVLPSVGLTREHALCVQERLAAELGHPLDAADKRRFLGAVLSAGVIGPYFRSNVIALLEAFSDHRHAA